MPHLERNFVQCWILDTSENRSEICVISGFRREVDANRALLGYYTASSVSSLPTFRDNLSVPSSRVKMDKISSIDREHKEDSLYAIFAQKLPSKTRYWRKVEGRIEGTERWGRRPKQLLDDMKEKRRYCKLKEEALARTPDNSLWKRLWTFRKTRYVMTEWVNEWCPALPGSYQNARHQQYRISHSLPQIYSEHINKKLGDFPKFSISFSVTS
jgi:hypothetical protein